MTPAWLLVSIAVSNNFLGASVMIRSMAPLGIALFLAITPLPAMAQESKPDLSAFSPATRKSYEDTQKFINKTRDKINLVRTQADARAKEIEDLANRVSKIITKMSGQGEDNSALQSEISVLNELLALERKTTAGLRGENAKLGLAVEIAKTENFSLKKQHANQLINKEAELAKAQKLLTTALSSVTTREKTNNVLVTNIEKLTTETVRLKKQIKILKENRYRPKRRFTTPK
jgi:septal ring factor EnvC (AmiA/AmiB activator)